MSEKSEPFLQLVSWLALFFGDGVTHREAAQFLCWPFAGKTRSVFIGSVHGGRKDSSFSKVGNVVKLVKLQLHSTFTNILSQNLTVKNKIKYVTDVQYGSISDLCYNVILQMLPLIFFGLIVLNKTSELHIQSAFHLEDVFGIA